MQSQQWPKSKSPLHSQQWPESKLPSGPSLRTFRKRSAVLTVQHLHIQYIFLCSQLKVLAHNTGIFQSSSGQLHFLLAEPHSNYWKPGLSQATINKWGKKTALKLQPALSSSPWKAARLAHQHFSWLAPIFMFLRSSEYFQWQYLYIPSYVAQCFSRPTEEVYDDNRWRASPFLCYSIRSLFLSAPPKSNLYETQMKLKQ